MVRRLEFGTKKIVFTNDDKGREIVATLWDAHAWLWHGYEVS